MKLYIVERTDDYGYDVFISFVAVANSKEEVKNLNPSYNGKWDENYSTWIKLADKDTLKVTYIGTASAKYTRPQIIHLSFNAG